jgi:hypothetical protein
MGERVDAVLVGKWHLGYDRPTKHTIVGLEFGDRPPLYLAIPSHNAVDLAKAILDQQQNPP